MSRTLIRGGCVLSLGAKTPNFDSADVLIEDGRVAEVGPGLRARDAEVIDASNAIVMPGFIDAHRHGWKTLFRNLGSALPGPASTIRQHLDPDDLYSATLLALLSAARTGITTVVDWADGCTDEASTDAVLQAHADAGLRTVLVHPVIDLSAERPVGTTLQRIQTSVSHLNSVAAGTKAPETETLDDLATQWEAIRNVGLRIHAHAGGAESAGAVQALSERGLLGEDVTLVHCTNLGDADLDAISSSKARVVLTPSSEMAAGLGTPPVQAFIDRSIRPGLGVDDELLGPGDVFAQIRAAISLQHATYFDLKLAGKAGLPNLLTTREVIRYATVNAAASVGLEQTTGSIEHGKQADIIVLRTDRPNIFPINDPIGAVVWGMDTSNIDWVFVAGRALVSNGELEADVDTVRAQATAARDRIVAAGIFADAGDRT